MVVSSGQPPESPGLPPPGSLREPQRKKRISSIFGQEKHQPRQQSKPMVAFYLSPKPKDRKRAFLSLQEVTQAFAVYPERPELINKSTLMKIEGKIGREGAAMNMGGREGWLLVMPELEAGVPQANETIRWLIGTIMFLPVRVPAHDWHLTAFHDSFSLYGRPRAYSWDPRDMGSMMFAYPAGPSRDVSLFFTNSYPLTPKYPFFYPVTLHGTRIRRDHGSPGGSYFCYPNASQRNDVQPYARNFWHCFHLTKNKRAHIVHTTSFFYKRAT